MVKDVEKRVTTICRLSGNEDICSKAMDLAYYLDNTLIESREKSLAFTHLQEVVFWANMSISCNS